MKLKIKLNQKLKYGMRKNKTGRVLIFLLIFAELFAGQPSIHRNLGIPLIIREAQAAAPTFVTAGIVAAGTAAITPQLPGSIQTNDILLLFLETDNQAISIANQSGGTWAEVTNSPQGTGVAADGTATRLTVFWSRYNGTQTAPVTTDSGNHQIGRIIAIRGVTTSGNPWNVTAGNVEAVADTSGSIPGAGTTIADTFVVTAVATALPDATGTANFSAWSNGNLAGVAERVDNSSNVGNGGAIGVATGTKGTAGNYGSTTVTTPNAKKGLLSIALKPNDTSPPTPNPMTFASPPTNDSTTQISMTATTAVDDYTPPVEYLFTLDNTSCGSDAGSGGSSSSWLASTLFSDSGLDTNKCYGYTVTARDSVSPTPNTGTASSISSTYTSANIPGTPSLGSATATTLSLTNDANGNPSSNPATDFAVQVVTTSPSDVTWLNKWVDASGNPSNTEVWQNDAAWDTEILTGLNYATTYGVEVKARNEDNDETALSSEGQGTTAAVSIIITTDGTISYGQVSLGESKSTIDLSDTQTAQNNGGITEDFNIKTSNATNGTQWTVGSSPGTNIFVHEFSSNGGGAWTKFTAADSYQTLKTGIAVSGTQDFDLRITAPSESSDYQEKSIIVTVQATAQ